MNKDLKNVKEDIRALILSANDGLSITQLEKDYFNFNGFNIPFGRYGYPSLLAFLNSITDVITIQGHGKHAILYPIVTKETKHIDYMIQKQRKPTKKKPRFRYKALKLEKMSSDSSQYTVNRIEETRQWNPTPYVSQANKRAPSELNYSIPSLPSTIAESFPADHYGVGALPEIDSDDEINFMGYPSDVIRFTRDIKFINEISEAMDSINDFYPVHISYVRTPYKLWFQLNDKAHLDWMNGNLQTYYENLTDDELILPETDIREKRACAARFKGKWCRGEIVSDEPDQDGDYKIFRLDYGNVVTVSPKFIKFLMNHFGKLPRQAYRGRLASVKPKRIRWSRKASEKLEKFVSNKILYAKLEHFDPDDQCHYLSLLDTNTEEDIDVGQYLVSKYSDVLSCEPKGKSSLALKIPTFLMLEQGLTPLTSEYFE